MPTRPDRAYTVEQDAARMSEDHARAAAVRDAVNVRDLAERVRRDFAAERVPSGSDVRALGSAAADLARGVGLLSAWAEARKLLNDDRVMS